jgi:hypothetical protein
VVRDREPRQADLDPARDQILDRRRAIEEREVRVAVELRVGHRERPSEAGFEPVPGRPEIRPGEAQQRRVSWRLTPVDLDLRALAVDMTRTAAMLLLAVLLVLVLLPAALAANGA